MQGKALDTREEGYKVAEERSIKRIGEKLKEIYEIVLKNKRI